MANAKGSYIGGVPVMFKDEAARNMISKDVYDATKTYQAGDFCIWENELKRATAETSGAFDTTAWESVTLADVARETNSNLYEIRFGTKTIESVAVGAKATLSVVFDTEMPSVPTITISCFNKYPEFYSEISAYDVTKKGFTAYAVNNYTSVGNITFSYIAICKK